MYGVEPDMAMFGKALGNGYAITATIGRREIMEAAQSTFISSTFWTERIGPTAALKTLEVMAREKSWEQITKTGTDITAKWKALSAKHGLSITTSGIPAFTGFSFNSKNALAYKTLITQEMLQKGYFLLIWKLTQFVLKLNMFHNMYKKFQYVEVTNLYFCI